MRLCYDETVDALGIEPTLDGDLFAMLARDPYVELEFVPARYKTQARAIGSVPAQEVVVTEGNKTTRLPLEVSAAPAQLIPSPKLLAEKPGAVRKSEPVSKR